ncbi:hypothetical protein B0H16DRAFT_156142 [Mycena metata]|uniref:TRIP4/RQT4 C2HC5-type zinc finger domain-containing protein n=1 Tax=Mycena metata TaxID=1033252 RepID=A0AAD7MVJ4_9AGAR|nr:hypothetical protein B0H16DRAFT_156142 [Mycena metata]
MHHTAWTKKASTLPSDRIRPPPQPAVSAGKNSKGKAKTAIAEPPKSKAVRQLESLKNGLTASYGSANKDPKGGCFCQAKGHALSTHSPLCRNCGLVLCEINLPQYACPHCSTALLSGTQQDALIARLEAQISETLAQEAQLRERAAEEARRAVGAFPTLGNTTPPSRPAPPAVPQTRTVMSLNSKTKKVTVSAFVSTPSPSPSRPASRAESIDEEPVRVAKPPVVVPFVSAAKQDPLRPWKDLSGDGAVYIPAPNLDGDEPVKGPSRKRGRNKGKAKENEGEGEGSQAAVAGGSRVAMS